MQNDPRKNPLLFKCEPHAIFCGITALYMSETAKTGFFKTLSHDKRGFYNVCFICLVLLLNKDRENEYPHLRKNITHLSDSCHFYSRKIAV